MDSSKSGAEQPRFFTPGPYRIFGKSKAEPSDIVRVANVYFDIVKNSALGLRTKEGVDSTLTFLSERKTVVSVSDYLEKSTHLADYIRSLTRISEVVDISGLDSFLEEDDIVPQVIDDAALYAQLLLHRARVFIRNKRFEEVAKTLADANRFAIESGEASLVAEVRVLTAASVATKDLSLAVEKLEQAKSTALKTGDHFVEGIAEFRHGLLDLQGGKVDGAKARFDTAERIFYEHINDIYLSDVLVSSAYVAFRRGELDVSSRTFERAIETLERVDSVHCAPAMFNAASVHLSAGNLKRAAKLLDRASLIWRAKGIEVYEGICALMRGTIELEIGSHERAAEHFVDAQSWARWVQDDQTYANAMGMLGVTAYLDGNNDLAERRLRDAIDSLSLAHGVEHMCLFLVVQARLTSDETNSSTMLNRLRESIDVSDVYYRSMVDGALQLIDGSTRAQDIGLLRIAMKCSMMVQPTTSERREITHRLRVEIGGVKFQLNNDEVVDISTRRPLRLLLDGFSEAFVNDPARAFSVGELMAIGWPDDQMTKAAGKNRVYTAMRFLRACGLEACLVTTPFGYRFSDETQLERVTSLD